MNLACEQVLEKLFNLFFSRYVRKQKKCFLLISMMQIERLISFCESVSQCCLTCANRIRVTGDCGASIRVVVGRCDNVFVFGTWRKPIWKSEQKLPFWLFVHYPMGNVSSKLQWDRVSLTHFNFCIVRIDTQQKSVDISSFIISHRFFYSHRNIYFFSRSVSAAKDPIAWCWQNHNLNFSIIQQHRMSHYWILPSGCTF